MKYTSYINIPLPTLKRFPTYYGFLRECEEKGLEWVSASLIANRLNLKPIQVRKDLSCTGVVGKPKKGFLLKELKQAISFYMGEGNLSDIILVGVGNLGKALLGDRRLTRHGFKIVAAFDSDSQIIGQEIGETKILDIEKLETMIQRLGVKIAILTVPEKSAQEISNKLIHAGVKGLWNFSSHFLDTPAGVTVINEDLGSRLSLLAGQVTHNSSHVRRPTSTKLSTVSFQSKK